MTPLTPTELANTITGVCTFLAGVTPLVLSREFGPHARRWTVAWASIVATGVATVWYHGFGESDLLRAIDTGSNLVVTVCIQAAILGDLYADRFRRRFLAVSASINAVAIAMLFLSKAAIDPGQTLQFGGWGGYHLGEIVLVADAFSVVGLWAHKRDRLTASARRLLGWAVGFFLVGAALSTADSHRIAFEVVPLHAAWHVASAFGFVLVWAAAARIAGQSDT